MTIKPWFNSNTWQSAPSLTDIGPLPNNLNLYVIKPSFVRHQMIGFFYIKKVKNPTVKNHMVPTLGFFAVVGPMPA
jgi:hypothetical protein